MISQRMDKQLRGAGLMTILFLLALFVGGISPSFAQFSVVITEINPDQSTLDPMDADGASGGRVNGLSVTSDGQTLFAASEWGGLYKSLDAGLTWFRLDSHLPVATWDVAVDTVDSSKVYATSFYDGRVNSLAGINVSTDGGDTWTHPATAAPPAGFCVSTAREEEPSAFGIAIDPDDTQNVYVGTNCGLAISNDGGGTWSYIDPTPADLADDIWDVVVHDGGIIDLVGDDGHRRSIDGGATWTTALINPLPGGTSSIAVSPDESYVLFAVVGTTIYESDDGGASWPTILINPSPQGRIPFVATNQRSGETFDLWFGDVQLHRASCVTPALAALGGAPRCPINAWIGPFTRAAGGHDDTADMVFNPSVTSDACPMLFSSDGGVYYNTLSVSPGCHSPAWEQPNVTPHSLWLFAMDGADQPGAISEDLYFGNQDTGTFAATNAGAPSPTWFNRQCCDGFDVSADPNRVLYTVCCCPTCVRSNRLFLRNPGMMGGAEVNTYPTGTLRGFRPTPNLASFGPDDYAVLTTSGLFITNDVAATPIVWTQLGAATTPATARGLKVGMTGGTPTFYVQAGKGDLLSQDQLWKYEGTGAGGTWQQVNTPDGTGGFTIYDVDPNDPNRLLAAHLSSSSLADPQMVLSTDGGATWTNLPALDDLMTGGGAFVYKNSRGPTNFTGFLGYPQPNLVAFDPDNANIIVAGGADSGVFVSIDGGMCWDRVTDPFDPVGSGIPHIPRPQFAYFDHQSTSQVDVYIGTQGRGVWRIALEVEGFQYEYAAKIVCGLQEDPEDMRLARGFYATTVNVHNPSGNSTQVCKKLALTYPPEEQAPGEVIPIATDELQYDEALKVDCMDLQERAFQGAFPTPYIEGFVILKSMQSLDVTSVYTTAALDEEGKAGAHSSIHVEQIRERLIEAQEDDDDGDDNLLPDLIPVPDSTGSFCRRTDDNQLIVTVKNQGLGAAGPSTTTVDFFSHGSISLPTPGLAPGASTDLLFGIPFGCFDSDCEFRITVDSLLVIPETDEGNNTASGVCFG